LDTKALLSSTANTSAFSVKLRCGTVRPQALLTLAYEGGHPDHDSCNFITSVIARERSPSWQPWTRLRCVRQTCSSEIIASGNCWKSCC